MVERSDDKMDKLADASIKRRREQRAGSPSTKSPKVIRRVGPGNRRDAGRKRIERALSGIAHATQLVKGPAIHGDDDVMGELALLRLRVGEIDDRAIADDDAARRMLFSIAYVIEHTFTLGCAAGGDEPFKEAYELRKKYRRGQKNATAAKRPAAWKAVAHQILTANKGRLPDEKIITEVCAQLDKLRLTKARRTVFNEVQKWKKATQLAS